MTTIFKTHKTYISVSGNFPDTITVYRIISPFGCSEYVYPGPYHAYFFQEAVEKHLAKHSLQEDECNILTGSIGRNRHTSLI